MIYVAACFWLIVIMLLAWGVSGLWRSLITQKTLNTVLFPGTVVLKLGRIVGLLITGARLGKPGAPQEGGPAIPDWEPRLPVIGPVFVALVPLVAVAAAVGLVMTKLGSPLLMQYPSDLVATVVPVSMPAFWEQLRSLITLGEATVNGLWAYSSGALKLIAFAYLMISLTVQLAPIRGNVRGQIGAIAALSGGAAVAGSLAPDLPDWIQAVWPLLALATGWLLVLLMVSLLACGVVGGIRMVLSLESP